MFDDNRAVAPPDPIPNSEVKRSIADDSVGSPHVKVGHRQALTPKTPIVSSVGVFSCLQKRPEAVVPLASFAVSLASFAVLLVALPSYAQAKPS